MVTLNPLLGKHWISDGEGHMVSEAQVRLAQVINEYDPEMFLVWIRPEDRTADDTHPFGILHERMGMQPYIIFTILEAEMLNPAAVLTRLWQGDPRRQDVFKNMEAYKVAQQALILKEQMDRDAERAEMVHYAVRALEGGHSYRMNGRKYG